MATIKAIEDRSVHQIQSGQVIVDLYSVCISMGRTLPPDPNAGAPTASSAPMSDTASEFEMHLLVRDTY